MNALDRSIASTAVYTALAPNRFKDFWRDNPWEHHDALEFPSGQMVLLTRLCAGQRATVLQLPARAHPAEDDHGYPGGAVIQEQE